METYHDPKFHIDAYNSKYIFYFVISNTIKNYRYNTHIMYEIIHCLFLFQLYAFKIARTSFKL